ncbi:MFS transporter [Paenibacillus validus]|uniref:MFS transporter n=1 Tax=Paenibacillus TaxID=44249 RepID=UPI000FDC4253|nr:MFS transporter [Paenibacillus validus]MED4604447.1 MFS transporter [Paenibacillus validus]MED4609880.1 MFS transporter [Paenibacillus validus]
MNVQQEPPAAKLWTRDFILLTVSNLLLYLNLQMITPALPAYVSDAFGADQWAVSLVISLFALSAIVARLFAGRALTKGSQRTWIVLIGLGLYILSTASFYAAGAFALFLAIRVLYGVGFGMTSTVYGTMASDVIPLKRIGEGMGYFGLSTGLSMALAPVIGLWLLDAYGFGTLVFVSTVLGALILPLTFGIRTRRVPSNSTGPSTTTSATSAAVRIAPKPRRKISKTLAVPFLLSMMLSFTYGGLISFLALFGKEAHLANVGWFFLTNAAAIVLIRPIAGKLFDLKGHRAVLPPAALLVIAGLICLSYTAGIAGLLLSAAAYGLGYGMLQPSLQAWMVKSVRPEMRGAANAAFYNSIDLGIAFGSLLLGSIAAGVGYAIMYRASAVIMLVFLLVYGLALLAESKALPKAAG